SGEPSAHVPREDAMPAKTRRKANPKSVLGGILLAGGASVMLAYLGLLGSQCWISFHNSYTGSLASYVGLGLASLRLLQSVTFDHGPLFSLGYQILVLFSGLAISLAGLALLHSRTARSPERQRTPALKRGHL